MRQSEAAVAAAASIVAVTRLLALPAGFWEGEELRFAQALQQFDPFHQIPEPPSYPLFAGLSSLLHFFVRDPFRTLVVLSVAASIAGAILLARAVGEWTGKEWSGAAAAILLYCSPALWIYGPLPNAEATAAALVSAAVLGLVRGHSILFAFALGGAVACRPQLLVASLVLLLVALSRMRDRLRALLIYAAVVGLAALAVIFAVEPGRFAGWASSNLASIRVASEAAGPRGVELLLRFVAHPWGPKALAFPVLLAALLGFLLMVRTARRWEGVALAAFSAVHILFSLWRGDRTDGVQPVIPALIGVAMFAASAAQRWWKLGFALAMLYAIASFFYVQPLLNARRQPSPPMAAAAEARRALPRRAVLLFEPSLEAHAQTTGLRTAQIRAMAEWTARPETPLYLMADGGSRTQGTRTFAWPDSDAYGKITTERYRVVSLVPLPPARRMEARAGVYSWERTAEGKEWRWLARAGIIDLPPLGNSRVRLRLSLPADSPLEVNRIEFNGIAVEVRRGQEVEMIIPFAPRLAFRAQESLSSGRDRRDLAVQLLALEQF